MSRILIVEDRDSLRKLMCHACSQEGHEVTAAATGTEGVERIAAAPYDLILTDLEMPGASGLEIVTASREHQPHTPVVVITAFGTVQSAVEAMKLGASDFLEKPLDIDDLVALASDLGGGSQAIFEAPGTPPIVGRHPTLRAALRLLQKVAKTDSTVLLNGESGTGKELFARALHGLSKRSAGPFVAVNCAAIPESLVENELFGHEKGAFTGADKQQAGRFERARSGTLFLDEIGELPPAVQGKVLRVLEERTFERVGGSRSLRADVRLVAATNRDLGAMVRSGDFRSDLFYRLDVFPIELPPLRQRASDIPGLARHLLAQLGERLDLAAPRLAPDALELLADQPWPGNVRQLANVLERALILGEGPILRAADLMPVLGTNPPPDERAEIHDALVQCDGDKQRTAELLGVSLRSLQRKIRRFDLQGVPKYRVER